MVRRAGKPPALSKESAVRWPVPLMRNTSELPLTQPGRETISCTSPARFGVRCVALDSPAVHAAGDHGTLNAVSGRAPRLFTAVVKGAALSLASTKMFSTVTSLCDSSAVN